MGKYIITNMGKIYFLNNQENVYKSCEGDAKWQNL